MSLLDSLLGTKQGFSSARTVALSTTFDTARRADAGALIVVASDRRVECNVPPNTQVPFANGEVLAWITHAGLSAGATLKAGAGVEILPPVGKTLEMKRGGMVYAVKVDTNRWLAYGDLSEAYEASSYGVAQDGTTNDAVAMAAAIAAIPSGSTLLIRGMVALGAAGLTIARDDITILGVGNSAGFRGKVITALANRYYTDEKYWVRVTGDRVTLRNLVFDQGGSVIQHAGYVDFQQTNGCTFDQCRVIEAYNYEGGAHGGNPTSQYVGPVVIATGGTGLTISGCAISNCHWSMLMGVGFTGYEERNVTIRGSTVTDCHTVVDGTVIGLVLEDSTFTRISRGSPNFGGATIMSANLTVRRNTFVDSSNVFKCDGISGSRIVGITIEDNTLVNSTGTVSGVYIYLCSDVTIQRNHFRYTGTAAPNNVGFSAITVDSTLGAIIADNLLSYERADQVGDLYCGITLTDAVAVATDYVVRGNTISGFYGPSNAGGNAGISIGHPGHDGTWSSLLVENNTISDISSTGIRMFLSHFAYSPSRSLAGVTVRNNTISGSGWRDWVNDGEGWGGFVPGPNNVYTTSGHISYSPP